MEMGSWQFLAYNLNKNLGSNIWCHVVSTPDSTDISSRWIKLGIGEEPVAIVDHEDCHFKFQNRNLDIKALSCVQSEDFFSSSNDRIDLPHPHFVHH